MLKFNTSKPTYKVLALGAFFCGIAAQPTFAGTLVADGKIQSKDVAATDVTADTDFKKLDVNSDKKISLKEAVKDKGLVNSFDTTDANKDGSITIDEFSNYKISMQMKSMDSIAPSSVTPSAGSSNAGSSSAAPVSAPPANSAY